MAQQTEKEVFSDCHDLWMKYIYYKIYSKSQNRKPAPPAVWLCAETLVLIDKGLLVDIDRKEAEEALNQLGWSLYINLKGELALRPYV